MARDANAPVAPFGATRAGVTGLVPEARLIVGDGPPPVGQYGVTEGQVDAWVEELSASVALRLDGWERLTNTPVTDVDAAGNTVVVVAGDRDRLVEHARTVVHNGAGSYLEAARHPERAAVNDTSYAAVLWDRYRAGLEDLVGWLTVRLARLAPGDEPAGDVYAGGPAYDFPPPLFGDSLRF